MDVGFPSRFIDSVVRDFSSTPVSDMDDIIPPWLFDDRQVLTVRLPFCPKNEEVSKTWGIHQGKIHVQNHLEYENNQITFSPEGQGWTSLLCNIRRHVHVRGKIHRWNEQKHRGSLGGTQQPLQWWFRPIQTPLRESNPLFHMESDRPSSKKTFTPQNFRKLFHRKI